MREILLVRHGRATGGWDDDPDPGLDAVGREQADRLADRLAPMRSEASPRLVTSPLRRCRETAAPLARRWGVAAAVEPTVAEIPSPDGVPFGERVPWLRAAMTGTWSDLGDRFVAYRSAVVSTVGTLPAGTVVVSHFVAINAVIGACLGDDRLVIR
ncbi:MAG: histidine phosphatase family protein, partial [Desertimonas sp.]